MRQSLIALAALGAIAGTTRAPTSVTLYVAIDTGIEDIIRHIF